MAAPGDAYAVALSFLSRKGRSRRELQSLLERRGFPPEAIAQALARCAELGYLDDSRYALHRAQSLLRGGKLGPESVKARLLAQGIAPEDAHRALEQASRELSFDPLDAARKLLVRRGLSGELDEGRRAKAARLLSSRGFSAEVVERLLGVERPPQGD